MSDKYNELMQLIEQVEDVQLKNKMNTLATELHGDLASSDAVSDTAVADENDVLDQLETAINKLEAEHPEVTTLLNNVMQSLSNLGI